MKMRQIEMGSHARHKLPLEASTRDPEPHPDPRDLMDGGAEAPRTGSSRRSLLPDINKFRAHPETLNP